MDQRNVGSLKINPGIYDKLILEIISWTQHQNLGDKSKNK